jgi:aromatic-L-amino-acid/L-tryptophan decarboxylase
VSDDWGEYLRVEGAKALEWAAGYLDGVDERPVSARAAPGEIRALLPDAPPEEPEPFDAILADLDRLMPGVTHWQHPRFFAYFATTASPPGILAELLAATLNQVAFIWRTSPLATELELLATEWLAQLLGLPAGWHGHIEDTASTSTLAALAAARAATGRRVVLASEQAHSAVDKAARILDMELRKVPVDDAFRMRPDLLTGELATGDVAAVLATVGTTSTTSVDPVRAVGELARAHGAWLHVDAAYAGSAWVCPETRWSADGVELADSLVVNPHKWLYVPMDCSVLWTARPEALREAFALVPEYLRTDDDVDGLSDYGPALGRRFRALKLWAVMRCYGRAGLQERIRSALRLAELLEGWVRDADDWELCAPRPFSTVCLRRRASDGENEALLERVNATGEIFISHTRLHGRYVLRVAIGHERTTEADVRRAWDVLRREAART